MIHVDGSFGEGGGQIIRNAVTLTCLLRKKVEVVKIRAGRPNPGLASQHLESILAMLRLTGASSTTKFGKGITEFNIDAREISLPSGGVTTTIDLKTAGSINLSIQCILPYLLTLKSPSIIEILGGTHVMKAPNVDYMNYVFLPTMKHFLGYNLELEMTRAGYFPRGGGRVELKVNPITQGFNSFNITQRGKLLQKNVILNLESTKISPEACIQRMFLFGRGDKGNIKVNNVNYTSVEYFLRFENAYAGFYYLLPDRMKIDPFNPVQVFEAIEKVEKDVNQFFESSLAAVDSFMQDQLIIYMTLAKLSHPNQVSQFRTIGPLTDHTQSAIHISEKFTGLKFNIETEHHQSSETCLISL